MEEVKSMTRTGPPSIDWDWNLTNHRPTDEGIEKIEKLRAKVKEYIALIEELTPPGREQSIALTSIETGSMYANAAIARTETADVKPS